MGGRDLLGLGGMLAGSVVGCTVLGLLVDHFAGSSPAGAVVGVGLGIALGATAFVLRALRALRESDQPGQPDPDQRDK
jgi:F0F1-type ATP synthase assembly protein I